MSNKYPLMFALHIYNDLNQSTKPSIPPDTTIAGLTELLRERHERGEYITYLSHKNPTGMSFGLVDFVNGLAGGHNP